jgi:predicted nucleic acid-binding protein
MNDRDGNVAVARHNGFAVTGTLGILDLAARRDLIQLDQALERLGATSFRCRPEIPEIMVARPIETRTPDILIRRPTLTNMPFC